MPGSSEKCMACKSDGPYKGRFPVTVCMVPRVRDDARRDLDHDGTIRDNDLRPNLKGTERKNEQFLKP